MNTIGGLRTLRHRRGALVTWVFTAAAYNIVRLRRLLATAWAHGARYERLRVSGPPWPVAVPRTAARREKPT